MIKSIWKDAKRNKGNQEIKQSNNDKANNGGNAEKLTFKTMERLQDGKWLNDDLINRYIELIENQPANRLQNTEILNTYFATTTIGKSQKILNRYLLKKNISRTSSLLIPINHNNTHWYFSKLDENTLVIFDSMRKSVEHYQENNIIKSILKFAAELYGKEVVLEVDQGYPQQENGYDCGMFMLMGLRDLMQCSSWSFQQGDIKFKRIQTSL